MRFQIRWNNGYYKLFDTERYEDVEMHSTLREAQAAEANLNARGGKR